MLRPFFLTSAVLLLLLFSISIHAYIFNKNYHSKQIANITKLSGINVLSLSVSQHEPRFRYYERASNISYPELLSIESMSYVYE